MIKIEKGTGRYKIQLLVEDTGQGLVLLLTGGERPHVGGIVLATPRESLSGKGMSADIYVIPVAGHKDTDVIAPIAKRLCTALMVPVSATAGIHIENADTNEIGIIGELCRDAVNELEMVLTKE